MHDLLTQQLQQHFGGSEHVPPGVRPLVADVDRAYAQADAVRLGLEHSMATMSGDLSHQVQRLRDALAESHDAKEELKQAVSLLSASLESTADGILVVDRLG